MCASVVVMALCLVRMCVRPWNDASVLSLRVRSPRGVFVVSSGFTANECG